MRMSYFLNNNISDFLINEINATGINMDDDENCPKFGVVQNIVISFSCVLLVFIKSFFRRKCVRENAVLAIARVPHGKDVLEKSFNDLFVIEDYNLSNSIVKYLPHRKRLVIFGRSLHLSIELFNSLRSFFVSHSKSIYNFYRIRIPQYAIFTCCLDELMNKYTNAVIYSSQLIDRFAYAEYEVAKHYGVRKICLPHGLEPVDIEIPFPCDEMICMSEYAANLFKKKYEDKTFVYNESIVRKIYSRGKEALKCDTIVFFSQGCNYAEETKFWIEVLKEYIKNSSFYKTLVFKIRYNDENIGAYGNSLDGVELSEDIDDCLSSKVCISFFSTTIYEALFNNSFSIAIDCRYLRDHPDFIINRHPEIIKVKDVDELYKALDCISKAQCKNKSE